MSVFRATPGVHRDHHDGLTRMPGSRNCRYSCGRAGQRAAEQVREHQHQHDRERGHVEELLGDVLDLQHRPPAEGQRGGDAALGRGPARVATAERRTLERRSSVRRRRCSMVVLMRRPPSVVAPPSAGWPVRARNTSSRLGWPSAKSSTTMPARASSARAACRPGSGSATAGGQRHRVGVELRPRAPSAVASTRCGLGPLPRRRAAARAAVPGADRRLELAAGALGDDPAVVDDRDAVGQLVGLVEVLRGQQHRRAVGRPAPGRCPRPGCGCAGRGRWSARRGRAGRGVTTMLAAMSSRRRMPPEYFFTCRSAASARPNALEQLVGPARAAARRGVAEQPAEQDQVLRAGQVLVDRGELPGEADPAADRVGLAHDVVAEHPRRARRRAAAAWPASGSWWSCRRRSGRARRRRRPRDREVDAVDRRIASATGGGALSLGAAGGNGAPACPIILDR